LALSLALSEGPALTENRLACFTLILASALTIADVAEANKNELPILLGILGGFRALNEADGNQ
jgi:hypothetical protein